MKRVYGLGAMGQIYLVMAVYIQKHVNAKTVIQTKKKRH
ncbi:hypothetical protein PPBDW_I60070 [Photobacterium kishitanii]|nr:hypothetical protein PPBDW_I60070 [Photobacterium kishitanii]